MYGWILSAVLLVALVVVWYYRAQNPNPVSALVAENKAVLADLNTLLKSLAAQANSAAGKDQLDAKEITTAKDAATFLNASGGNTGHVGLPSRDSNTRVNAATRVRTSLSARRSHAVLGFARGPSYVDGATSLRTGSVDESRNPVA